MAHPYHHAVSSSRSLIPTKLLNQEDIKWEDHFPIHDWLDSSKFAFADARHRSLFHNPAGILIASKIFKNIKGAKKIATQHIIEDMGVINEIQKWLPLEYYPPETLNGQRLEISSEISRTDVKGSLIFKNPFPPTLQRKISFGLELLLSPEKTEKLDKNDPRRFFFFSSAGPYIVEKLLGPTLNPRNSENPKGQTQNKLLATRSVFEFFIQKVWGLIPSHQDLMGQRPIEDWMWKKAKPLSKEL
jgi:hypothetical protein